MKDWFLQYSWRERERERRQVFKFEGLERRKLGAKETCSLVECQRFLYMWGPAFWVLGRSIWWDPTEFNFLRNRGPPTFGTHLILGPGKDSSGDVLLKIQGVQNKRYCKSLKSYPIKIRSYSRINSLIKDVIMKMHKILLIVF